MLHCDMAIRWNSTQAQKRQTIISAQSNGEESQKHCSVKEAIHRKLPNTLFHHEVLTKAKLQRQKADQQLPTARG